MKVTAVAALLAFAVQAEKVQTRLQKWNRKDVERRTKCASGSCIVVLCPKSNIDRFTEGKQMEGAALRHQGYNIGCDKGFMISADENVCWKYNDANLDLCAKGKSPTPFVKAKKAKYAEKLAEPACATAAKVEADLCYADAKAKALERKKNGTSNSGASAIFMGATLTLTTAILF